MVRPLVLLAFATVYAHLNTAGAIEMTHPVDKACLEKNAKEYVSCFAASGGDPAKEAACKKAQQKADQLCPRK